MKRFRFTLKSVLVVVFCAAIGLAFSTRYVNKLRQVAADVELLRECKANVDIKTPEANLLSRFVPRFQGYPTDVRKYFDTPDLENTDNFIDVVGRNKSITSLTIDGSPMSDAQAKRLLSLPISSLMISGCRVGDQLAAKASPSFEFLAFPRTRLNSNSLAALGELPNLRYLDLTRTRVSDSSIEYLASRPSLAHLIIRRCKISQKGLEKLRFLRPDMNVEWEPL